MRRHVVVPETNLRLDPLRQLIRREEGVEFRCIRDKLSKMHASLVQIDERLEVSNKRVTRVSGQLLMQLKDQIQCDTVRKHALQTEMSKINTQLKQQEYRQ
jgi:hypothetical protein